MVNVNIKTIKNKEIHPPDQTSFEIIKACLYFFKITFEGFEYSDSALIVLLQLTGTAVI